MAQIDAARQLLSLEAQQVGFQAGGYLNFEEDCDASVALRELMDSGIIAPRTDNYFRPGEYEACIDRSLQRWNPAYPRRGSLCRYGLCEIPRHDGGKVFYCMASVGISHPQAADLPTDQFVLGSYAGTAQAGKEALRCELRRICPEVYSGTRHKKEVR